MTETADGGASWPDHLSFEDGGSSDHPDVYRAILELPERFKEAGRRLVAELITDYGVAPATLAAEDASGSPPWYQDLELEEAWAIAEAVRRSMGWESAQELDGALDRALLHAALSAETRTAAAHRRMLEDVSHDLRSPLNSILFLADALQAERSGPLDPVQARQVGILYTAAVTLVGLVNDLIDFARLDSRERIRVAYSSFSLESVLNDVNSLLGPLVSLRGVSVLSEIETEGLRSGDPQLLSRVMLNLVSNAVQAVDEGGRVSVRVAEVSRGDLSVEIRDNRVATDEGHLRALIDSAEAGRLPGETRGWTHGLGLTICARLVKAAEGRLHVRSRTGEGTTFTLELPFRRL